MKSITTKHSAALVRRRPRSFSITCTAFCRAATRMDRRMAAISRTFVDGTWLEMLRHQCTMQRCHAASVEPDGASRGVRDMSCTQCGLRGPAHLMPCSETGRAACLVL
jgi:hypothetical protein